MAQEEPHMWPFWRDKKGFDEALEDYFPRLMKTNPLIAAAHMQIKLAQSAIDGEMARLSKEEYE